MTSGRCTLGLMIPLFMALWACSGGPSDDSSSDDSGDVTLNWPFPTPTPTVSTGSPTGLPPGDDVAIAAADEVAAGGHLWVLTFNEYLPLSAEIDGVPLAGQSSPSYPTAVLFDVPADHPPGPATVQLTSGGAEAVEQQLEVVIAEPRFTRIEDEIGLSDTHDTTGYQDGCAQALTGFAWADLDLDGDHDALIGHYGPSSRVLLNDGAAPGSLPTFTDVSAGSGFEGIDAVGGLAIADLEGDGDPDVFVGRRGVNRLLRNEFVQTGEVRFTDITAASGLDAGVNERRTMGGVWGDPDQDGDLDLYELNHTWCFPGGRDQPEDHPLGDRLWINDGGVFTDRSDLIPDDDDVQSGRFTFVGAWIDHQRDGDLDLFVISDFVPTGGPSVLLRNDDPSSLTLTDVSTSSGFAVHPDPAFKGVNGMGIAVGDINHDGHPDFAVSNIGPNLLVMSHDGSPPTYDNESEARLTTRTTLPWGTQSVTWGTQMFDHDNDGDHELQYLGGAMRGDALVPHAFFDNIDGDFVDITFASGLSGPGHGKASALVDLDRDGYLDLAVTNWGGSLEVYRNTAGDGASHHWLQVELEGDGATTHRDAFGAVVELTTPDDVVHTCFRTPSPSLSGGGDTACHFGLGPHTEVAELQVVWPDGWRETVSPPAVDQRITIVDGGSR